MTDGEKKLWGELQQFKIWHGAHFRKQAPIGNCVVDFVAHEHRLIVEVDGEHHFTTTGIAKDRARDDWLRSQGYRILRFDTGDIAESFDGCVDEILAELGLMDLPKNTLTPIPARRGQGGLRVPE